MIFFFYSNGHSTKLEHFLQGLRLHNIEIFNFKKAYKKNLLHHKKLYLVLDLYYTLLNSAKLTNMTSE